MANFVSYANSETLMQAIADKFKTVEGAFVYRGSVSFANLPSVITKNMVGYVYNINEDFTTDVRFKEGAGKKCPAGTNVDIIDVSDYALSADVTVDPTKTYYTYDSVAGEYEEVENPTGDPSAQGWYEYVVGFMFDTQGSFIDISAIMALFAGEFDDTEDYTAGQIVLYNNELYKFNTDHTAGAWDPLETDKKTVAELIDEAEPESLTQAQVEALLALLD